MTRVPWFRDMTRLRPLLVLLAAWMLLFGSQLFTGKAYRASLAVESGLLSKFSQERWEETRERTHWNPYIFTGVPTTASLADLRPQWLPDPLLDLHDDLRGMALWPPQFFELLAHLIGMLSIALLARRLWGAGDLGMVWAGLAWGLAPGLLLPIAYGHGEQLAASSLIPAVLLFADITVSDDALDRAIGGAVGLALALGLQGLAGHPQVLAYSLLLMVGFAVQRAWSLGRWPRLGWIGGALVLGLAVGAALWWPVLLHGQYAAPNGWPLEAVEPYSLAVRDLFAMVWPWAAGYGGPSYWGAVQDTFYPHYVGAAVVLFAILGVAGARARATAGLLLGAAIVAMIVALGTSAGGLYTLLRFVPFTAAAREPGVVLIVAQLAIALVSARGIERVAASVGERAVRGPLLYGWGAVVVFALAALLVGAGPLRDAYEFGMRAIRSELPPAAFGAAAMRAAVDLGFRALMIAGVIGALTMMRREFYRAAAIAAVLVVLAVDLGSVSMPTLWRTAGSMRILPELRRPVAATLAHQDPEYRAMILVPRLYFSNQWVGWQARSISGYHGSASRHWSDLRQHGLLGRENVLQAFSVQYVSGQYPPLADSTRFSPAPESVPHDPAWRAVFTMPRAYAVPRVLWAASDDSLLTAMSSPYFQPDQFVLTTDRTAEGEYPGSASCRVRWIEDEPDRLAFDTEADEASFLVVTDAMAPGWTATIDDQPVPIHRINHLSRGLRLPAGSHRVAFRYEPPGWTGAVTVTRLALALGLLLALAWGGRQLFTIRRAPA